MHKIRPSRAWVVVAVTAATTVACGSEAPSEQLVVLSPVASSRAPLSNNPAIALVSEHTACVIDSFDLRVHCSDSAGTVIGVFGQEGEGPGEFLRPVLLERVPDGTVAVMDLRLNRLSVFEPDGVLRSHTTVRRSFIATAHSGTSVFGIGPLARTSEPVSNGLNLGMIELDARSGEMVWQRGDLGDISSTECGFVAEGLPTPVGGYVFRACRNELVFLDSRDADRARVVPSPTYIEALPNERDVAKYLADMALMSRSTSLPASAMEPYAAAFREQPKSWFLVPIALAFDDHDRLWVATTRDRDSFSYLDIWIGTDYAGTVRIQDRLVGYDLLGSTLVALVERAPGPNGIVNRAIDWYDIEGIEFPM